MAIILKKDNSSIKLDSNKIIGIMGKKYSDFIKSFKGDNIGYVLKEKIFLKENVGDELKSNYLGSSGDFDKLIIGYLEEFSYEKDFLNKRINELSDSEKRILMYMSVFIANNSIIVIDNVYQDLDYFYKKKIKYWLRKMVKEYKKTILIGSENSEDIYDICQKVLLIEDDRYSYDDVNKIFVNSDLLKKYGINEPQIVKFVNKCHQKKIKIAYTNDIRDLIKEVYKNV